MVCTALHELASGYLLVFNVYHSILEVACKTGSNLGAFTLAVPLFDQWGLSLTILYKITNPNSTPSFLQPPSLVSFFSTFFSTICHNICLLYLLIAYFLCPKVKFYRGKSCVLFYCCFPSTNPKEVRCVNVSICMFCGGGGRDRKRGYGVRNSHQNILKTIFLGMHFGKLWSRWSGIKRRLEFAAFWPYELQLIKQIF